MNTEDKFLQYISQNLNVLKGKYKKLCKENHLEWDEDIFSDTYLKCYEAIKRKGGMTDDSEKGYENYFFRSFKQNVIRERQYSRIRKRDANVKDEDVHKLYEDYMNEDYDGTKRKVVNDLWKDYATLYMVREAEKVFDAETMHLFTMKYFVPNMTFRALKEKYPNEKKVRDRIIEVKNWIADNVTKADIRKAFNSEYGNLIE